jgi:hypothetical protein
MDNFSPTIKSASVTATFRRGGARIRNQVDGAARHRFRNKGKLSPERIARLEKMGFNGNFAKTISE